MNISFAKINGLPIKERLIDNNSNINDIITLKVNNIQIFCKIVGYTQTRMIKVVELESRITDINISFIEKTNFINPTTKNILSKTRKMHKITNIIYL